VAKRPSPLRHTQAEVPTCVTARIDIMCTAEVSSPSLAQPMKSAFACARCADRKVKCDRQMPCGACVNHKADCVFQPPRPPRRKYRHVKEQILKDRLKYYETLLQQSGIDPAVLPNTSSPDSLHNTNRAVADVRKTSHLQTPSSIEPEASGSVSRTQVVHGQGRSMLVDK
jgi:hypothetical protein